MLMSPRNRRQHGRNSICGTDCRCSPPPDNQKPRCLKVTGPFFSIGPRPILFLICAHVTALLSIIEFEFEHWFLLFFLAEEKQHL